MWQMPVESSRPLMYNPGLTNMWPLRKVFVALSHPNSFHNTVSQAFTKHDMATLLAEKNVWKLNLITFKTEHSKPIFICALPSFVI